MLKYTREKTWKCVFSLDNSTTNIVIRIIIIIIIVIIDDDVAVVVVVVVVVAVVNLLFLKYLTGTYNSQSRSCDPDHTLFPREMTIV